MNSAFRALIGSFYKPKKNEQFDPNSPLSETNQPYQDPSFGMRFWNPDTAHHINSLNEQAMLAPGERAAQMADWKARQEAALQMQNGVRSAQSARELEQATMEWRNPANQFIRDTYKDPQNYVNLGSKFTPQQMADQIGAAADIVGGVPQTQSEGRGLAAQRSVATDKGFLERLPIAQKLQGLEDRYNEMNTEGLINNLPAVQRYNTVKTAYDTDNIAGLARELPTTHRLQHINNLNAINQGLFNDPMTQQLQRSQTVLGQNEADTRLDNADVAKRTLENNMGNEEFRSQYPADIAQTLEGSRSLATRGPGGYSLIENSQFRNPKLQEFQDMQTMMKAMEGGGKGAAMGQAYGLQKKAAAPIPVGPMGRQPVGYQSTTGYNPSTGYAPTTGYNPTVGNTVIPAASNQGSSSVPIETAPTATQAAALADTSKKEKPTVMQQGLLPMAGETIGRSLNATDKALMSVGHAITDPLQGAAEAYSRPTVGQDFKDLFTVGKTVLFGNNAYKPTSKRPDDLKKAGKERDARKGKATATEKARKIIGNYNPANLNIITQDSSNTSANPQINTLLQMLSDPQQRAFALYTLNQMGIYPQH